MSSTVTMDDDASGELSGMIATKSGLDNLKKDDVQSFHNDQATPSKDTTVTVSHSFEAMHLFAQMQNEIDKQLIDIERRKKELIQSYLEATNARLKQELLGKEEESLLPPDDDVDDEISIHQMKRKRDVDVDETSIEPNKKKRRRLSRRMAVLLSDDDDEDDIAPSPPFNMMDAGRPTITNRRRTLEIDDAEILSLWKSSPVE